MTKLYSYREKDLMDDVISYLRETEQAEDSAFATLNTALFTNEEYGASNIALFGSPVFRAPAASGVTLHCLNVWTTADMQVYSSAGSGATSTPQIIYGTDNGTGAVYPMFCVDHGADATSGQTRNWVSYDSYGSLNETQKRAIAYVAGFGTTQPPVGSSGGYAGADTSDPAVQQQLKDYWSTQLMIWYFIDYYDEGNGMHGIDWDGLTRTCNAGWGDLTECNRIYDHVINLMRKPSFTEWYNSTAPVSSYPQVELTYNSTTGLYEGYTAKNSNTEVSIVDCNYYCDNDAINSGLSFTVVNDSLVADDTGNILKITSQYPVSPDAEGMVWGRKSGTAGTLWFMVSSTAGEQTGVGVDGSETKNGDWFGFHIYTEGGTGQAALNKLAGDSAYTSGNANYRIDGAEYTVQYAGTGTDYTTTVGVFRTDASGTGIVQSNIYGGGIGSSTMTSLPYGNYRVVETGVPAGYNRDTNEYKFTIDETNYTVTKTVTSTDYPVVPLLSMTKVSSLPAMTMNNGCYSLAGAEYQVYSNSACTTPATAYTVSGGRITGTTEAKFITNADGSANILHLLPGTYFVKETNASKGFMIDTQVHMVTVNFTHAATPQTFTSTEVPLEDPATIEIYKTDSEGVSMIKQGGNGNVITELGGASLAGAVFKVNYYDDYYDSAANLPAAPTATWYIQTEYDSVRGKFVAYLDADHLAAGYTSSPFYYNSAGAITFPLGTVTYQEYVAPEGFYSVADGKGVMTDASGALSGNLAIMQVRTDAAGTTAHPYVKAPGDNTFETNAHGVPIRVFTTLQEGHPLSVTEEVKRGDFNFVKQDHVTLDPMEGVYFKITASTGESHVIKTGANGYYSSSGCSHTTNTNLFDRLFDGDPDNDYLADGTYIGSLSGEDVGLWFYGSADESEWNSANIVNAKGAMRYDDSYTIEELACDANTGKQLLPATTFSITDTSNAFLGIFTNVPMPSIHTLEWDAETLSHATMANGTVTIKDTITYRYFTYNTTYTAKGILMELDENGTVTGPLLDAAGHIITANQTFKTSDTYRNNPQDISGSVDVTYTFEADGLIGKKFIIYEYMYLGRDDTPLTVDETGKVEKGSVLTVRGEEVSHVDDTDTNQMGYFVSRGRVSVIKTGPFVTGTTEFNIKLPNGQTQTVKRLSFDKQPFAGITFTIFDAKTNEPVTSFTTGSDGTSISAEVPLGNGETYYMRETETPAGLTQSSEIYELDFTNYNQAEGCYYTDTITVDNDVTGAVINVYKKGEFIIPNTTDGYGVAQKGIAGVYFGVFAGEDILDKDGNVVITKGTCVGVAKTGEDGVASVRESLVAGKYYFEELCTAGEEYQLDATRFDFSITYRRNTTETEVTFDVNASNPMLNVFRTRSMELLKTDGNGTALSGVSFALYREYNGEYRHIGTYQTGEDGKITITNIPFGKYYFIETKGVKGYQFDGETKYSFTVDDTTPDGEVIRITAVNRPDTPKTGDMATPVCVLLVLIATLMFTTIFIVTDIWKQQKTMKEQKMSLTGLDEVLNKWVVLIIGVIHVIVLLRLIFNWFLFFATGENGFLAVFLTLLNLAVLIMGISYNRNLRKRVTFFCQNLPSGDNQGSGGNERYTGNDGGGD